MNEKARSKVGLHLASAADRVGIKRLEHEVDWQYEKRCASIRALGVRWLNHPQYVFLPRHSVHTNVWAEARKPFLDAIEARAAADRIRNQAFHDAERARQALPRPTN